MPLGNDQLQSVDPLQQALLMAQMGQPTAPSHNPGEVQAAMIQALMSQRRADDMYERPPRRMEQMGWGSALTELARPFVAKRNEKKANEELAKAMGKQGDLDRYDAALAEYQAGIKDAQKAIDERSKFERQESYKTTQKNAEIPDKQKIAQFIMSKPENERAYWLKVMGGDGAVAAIQEFQSLTDGMSDDDILKARRIELGLDPRAVGSAPQTIAGLGNAPAIADVQGIIAEGTESGKLRAAGDAEGKGLQKKNAVAFDVYTAGLQGLAPALSNTETGPLAGLIPAVTVNQQTAEGAVAAMAPIMKQMFRAAGEGVFTDSDQRLLLDMIPKRTDHQEAIQNKLANIDSIVRAKLGVKDHPVGDVGQTKGDTDAYTTWKRENGIND